MEGLLNVVQLMVMKVLLVPVGYVPVACVRCGTVNMVKTSAQGFQCGCGQLYARKGMQPRGLELKGRGALFTCSTKLIDVSAAKLYEEPAIVVKWSMDTTCFPIIGCNAHRFRIELYDAAGLKVGTWYADERMREYYVRLNSEWEVTSAWRVNLTVEERFFVWFDCDSLAVPVRILREGERPEPPQKGKEPFDWTPYLVGGGIAVAGVIGLGYLIRSVR